MTNEEIARNVILWIDGFPHIVQENYAIKHKNQTNMEIVERTCKECGQLTKVGKTTKECLKCLDWKMGDLRK